MPADRPRSTANASKRLLHDALESGPPQKKRKSLLADEDPIEDASEISNDTGGRAVNQSRGSSEEGGFKVNEDYAKRFEYNKQREELSRCKDFPLLSDLK